MVQKIQIKRGNKSNLPLLAPGEPAFTLDTKEFFIGDGVANNRITATNKNLIINSNFQVSFDTFTNNDNTIILLPGESKYIYGNYYIQNATISIGTVTISRNFTDGTITILGVNSSISLEYREKLPRYTSTTGVVTYIKPFNGKAVTLSYDITNNTANALGVKTGTEANLISYYLVSGPTRKTTTFTMSYNESVMYVMQKIIVLAITTNPSFSITIGNIKLEEGNSATLYSPNALYYDVAMLNRIYFSCGAIARATQITTNAVKFVIPVIVPNYYNYDIKVIKEALILANITGTTQTLYTAETSYKESTTSIEINCTKVNHGMTDAYVLVKQYLDLRPY